MMKNTILKVSLITLGVFASSTALAADSEVLATVNGSKITKEQVDAHLSNIPAFLVQQQEGQIRKGILDKLVEQELLLQQANKMNVEKDSGYQNQLDMLKRNLTQNWVLQQRLADEITEARLRAAYEKAKDAQAAPAVKAKHILVKTEGEAKDIIKKLNRGGDFAELAKENSIGPSASNGGELGWFKEGDMVPAFSEAAFELKAGEYTKKPVQTQFGWHVIKAEEKTDSLVPTFEQMAESLIKTEREKVISAYMEELKDDAKIKYMEN